MLGHWALWARPARRGQGELSRIVLAVTDPWMTELPGLCPALLIKGAATCPTTGALCLLLHGANELLLLVPEPPKHGSQTPGVMLPW